MGDERQKNTELNSESSAARRQEIFYRAQNVADDLKI